MGSLMDDVLREILGSQSEKKQEKPPEKKPTETKNIVESISSNITSSKLIGKLNYSIIEEIVKKEKDAEKKSFRERPKRLLAEYMVGDNKVEIYEVDGEEVPVYIVTTIKPLSAPEQRIFNEAKEAAIRNIEVKKQDLTNKEKLEEIKSKIKSIVIEIGKKQGFPDNSPVIDRLTEILMHEIVGFGILDYLLQDDLLEEIMVIGTKKPVYVFHRKIGMCKTNIIFNTDEEIINIARRIAYYVDRRIDQETPILDARLPSGDRVNAVIPPIALEGPNITIRKFRKNPLTVLDLINFGTLTPEVAAFLWLAVDGLFAKPANIIIAGGTGSGKTTTLNTLGSFIPPWIRVITIEDTAELQLPLKHWIREETRPKSLEGRGEITMDDLVKAALRQRPDSIIVGEIRGPEARTLFTAMNTGHDGALLGDEPILLSDGRVIEIEEFVEPYFDKYTPKKEGEFEWIDISNEGIYIKSLNKETLKIEDKLITRIWRRKYKGKMIKILTNNGREITLTPDHPVYITKDKNIILEVNAEKVCKNDYIAVPKFLQYDGGLYKLELVNSNVSNIKLTWEQVIKIEEFEVNCHVYDLTVADNHTYIAGKYGGFIVSNCMGTLHANSARETIIRLKSPPMSVPSIMLTALNFIIMQNRILYKGKFVRRITEIAELAGMEGEEPRLNIIYQWDSKTDQTVRTEVPIHYLEELTNYTGLTLKQIHDELEERKEFLMWLVEKNKQQRMDIHEVGRYIQAYVKIKKQELSKK